MTIDRLATGGYGVGRHEGMVIFVPFAAPGDLVDVVISEVKKNFCFAEIQKVHLPSPHRVKPMCDHFGDCGGCNWQHIEYGEQLKQKQAITEWIFRNHHVKVEKIVASPNPWRYRRRIQLHQKNGQIGFLKRQSHEIVAVKSCPITRKEILEVWPRYDEKWGEKFEIGINSENEIYRAPLEKAAPEFTQVNEAQNVNLKNILLTLLKDTESKNVYDLYCGSGNFSFAVAQANATLSVLGVDSNSALIEKAQLKVKQNKLNNLDFICMKDDEIRGSLNFENSVVIVDPPRSGCSAKLIEKILAEHPSSLIYISCHPQTAERDIQILSKTYRLVSLTPIDMFPQTDHIEMIGLMR